MVYFIQSKTGLVKIGMSGQVETRRRVLQAEYHETEVLLAIIPDAEHDRPYHTQFRNYRVRGEWFQPAPELTAFIEALPKSCDCGDDCFGLTKHRNAEWKPCIPKPPLKRPSPRPSEEPPWWREFVDANRGNALWFEDAILKCTSCDEMQYAMCEHAAEFQGEQNAIAY